MAYRIVFASQVVIQDMPKLDEAILLRIQEDITSKLVARPELFGKPLGHSLRGHRSLRVGDFRVVYRIDSTIVRIVAIVHRRDVYRITEKRVS